MPEPGDPQALNRCSYVLNNPIKYRDPSGHWVKTAWDIANVGWSIYEVKRDPSLLNIGALVVDVAAMALPFVPAGVGLVMRGGKTATKVVTHGDEAVNAVRVAGHLGDAAQAHLRFTLVGKTIIPDVLKQFGGDLVRGTNSIPDAFEGRRVTAIGRWDDTQVAAKRGARTLDDPAWTLDRNADWILDAIASGDVIELVSAVNKGNLEHRLFDVTAFARELDALLQAGYTRVGNYLVPPR